MESEKMIHMKEKRERFCLLAGTLVLCLFNIGASPLIHAISADSALFVTMGRAMCAQRVLYRDIFDHKGLYVFLVNMVGALISGRSLNGLFLVETFALCFDILLIYRICRMIQNPGQSVISSLLFGAVGTNYFLFAGGNLVEEYALPFQLISLYLILRYLQRLPSAHPGKYMFIHGICCGFCLWLRANLVMMWIPAVSLILVREIAEKRYADVWRNIGWGLLGLCVISVPVLLYGTVNHCMNEMFFAAFTFNFQYTAAHGNGLIGNILKTLFNKNEAVVLLLCIGSCILVWKKADSWFSRGLFVSMFGFCFLSTALSGRAYWQYYVYLLPFTLPSLFVISEKLCQKKTLRKISPFLIVGAGICSGILLPSRILAECFDIHVTLYEKNRVDYKTCATLKEAAFPSSDNVLVTGGNSQFYVEMNVVPQLKYPFALSMSYEEFPYPYEEQLNSIVLHQDDVVVLVNDSYDVNQYEPVYDGLREEEVEDALNRYYRLAYRSPTTGTRMYFRK